MKKPSLSQSVVLTLKSPALRYSGAGFLYREKERVLYEAYEGAAAFRLSLSDRVCLNGRCISYEEFNRKFLSPCYPKELIKRVLLARPIKSLKEDKEGFVERLKSSCFDIVYSIRGDQVRFVDRKNHILIKVRRIDG